MTVSSYQDSNKGYWTNRAASYSAQHQDELAGTQHPAWAHELDQHLIALAGEAGRGCVRVLDIGCGPGFFSIILAELGYRVTAVDYTASMLDQARQNAANAGVSIEFCQMDAENLDFATGSFDAIVSRNLTWNLPHPCEAYEEWKRVLRAGGLLLNYDANWYGYLFDKELREGYESDRANTAAAGCIDRYLNTDIDAMEDLAEVAPLSPVHRPHWDKQVLEDLGLTVSIDHRVSDRVWSNEELVNQASTPLFGVKASKPL